ncbi:MAG: hypothetical protein R8P61_03535 [Bacteroidia bacterium]|nr:hypothetical protein [Bacteroidia bacterium]
MKLRCTHNSVRIRLKKSDLATLAEKGRVEEVIHFSPKSRLVFELIVGKSYMEVKGEFISGRLTVILPEEQAHAWIKSTAVGIEANQALNGEEKLHILIEKDFPCNDREDEDKSDTFWELAEDKPESC